MQLVDCARPPALLERVSAEPARPAGSQWPGPRPGLSVSAEPERPAGSQWPGPRPGLTVSLLPPHPAPAPSATDGIPSTHSANLIEEFFDAQHEYELSPYILKNTFNSPNTFTYVKTSPLFHPSMSPKEQYRTFIYPSLCPQDMKWSPFVQMTARCHASAGRMSKLKCRCSRCTNANCSADTGPGGSNEYGQVGCSRYRDSSTNPDRNEVPFRCNIATFCNQFTMTRELPRMDAACGGTCLGVDMAVAADCPAVGTPPKRCSRITCSRSGPRATLESASSYCKLEVPPRPPAPCAPPPVPPCAPPPVPPCAPPLCAPLCAPPPCARWHEPERDCGPEADFACTITTAAGTTTDEPQCFRMSSRCNISTEPPDEDNCNRRNLYNEGISDDVFVKLANCVNKAVQECCSQRHPRPEPDCCAGESWIPHSHRNSSKYHEHCKRNTARPCRAAPAPAPRRCPMTLHYPAADDCELPASPSCRSPSCFHVDPTCSRPASPSSRAPQSCHRSRPPSTCNRLCAPASRRQVLTSERDIESFLQAFML